MQPIIKFVLIAGIFLTSPGRIFGQETPIPLMSLNQWTSENGLISNNITSAIQAKEGFLWITTNSGIMRFDGKNFEIYNRYLTSSLAAGVLGKAYEDKHGTLWFVSRDSGILLFKNNTFSSFSTGHSLFPKTVKCLLIEDDSTIWVGSYYRGLYCISNENVQSVGDSLLQDVTVMDILKDHDNNLWIATEGYGLYKFNGTSFERITVTDGMRSDFVNVLALTSDGEVLAGTALGLNIIRRDSILSNELLDNNSINALKVDSSGSVWIGTESGLMRMRRDGKVEFANETNGFPFTKINSIDFDQEGNIWICTERNGLLKLRDSGIRNFTRRQGLSSNSPNAISGAPGKTIFVGSAKGTIDAFNNDGVFDPITAKLGEVIIRDILFDNNALWVATNKGVLKTTSTGKHLITKTGGLPDNDIVRILKDSNENLWFASKTSGAIKFAINGKEVVTYNKQTGFSTNNILAMEQDAMGRIYFGTANGGLNILQPDNQIRTFHVKGNDRGVLIFNIHIDSDGHVWLVTNIGLYFFDGTKINLVELKKDTRGETFFDLVEDRSKNFWLTSNAGVLRLDRVELKKYIDGKTTLVNTKLYDDNDGMLNRECSSGRAYVSATGEVWIPTLGGVTVIDPDKVIKTRFTTQPFITAFSTDRKRFSVDSLIEVPPGNLRYSVTFTVPNFTSPSEIQFKYKLDGIDRFWVNAKTKRQIEYTNLPPGDYRFQVIASMDDEQWNTKPASITFKVLPFFYETAWFYSIVVILLAAVLLTFYKWRVSFIVKKNRELQRLNNELDRFVYSASHDLRAPLSSILGLVALARIDNSDRIENYLSRIESSIQKLDSFVHDILDFSRNARVETRFSLIQFEPLVQQVIENLTYMDDQNRIKKSINITGNDSFYTDQKRLVIILNNLVSNAFKYHNPNLKEAFIQIDIGTDKSGCTISVKDNGLGIDKEHLDKIFTMFYRAHESSQGSGLGLYIVKETVSKLKGKITVQSEVGVGSTFKVTLPFRKKFGLRRYVAIKAITRARN